VDKFTATNISGEFNGLLNKWKGMPDCLLCGNILWYVYNKEDESLDPEKYWTLLEYYDVKVQRLVYTFIHTKCFKERFEQNGHLSKQFER